MNESQAMKAAAGIQAISNAMRIRMIQIMLQGELQVGDLAAKVGLSQSATSQHLQKFKRAGLLVQRKDKQWRYCAIEPKRVEILKRLISAGEERATASHKSPARP